MVHVVESHFGLISVLITQPKPIFSAINREEMWGKQDSGTRDRRGCESAEQVLSIVATGYGNRFNVQHGTAYPEPVVILPTL